MSKFIINGGKKLKGHINLAGNKNSALKLIPASLVSNSPCTITNVPEIKDIEVMVSLVEKLGAKVKREGPTMTIDSSGIQSHELDPFESSRIRASVLLAAPLLVRFGKAIVTPPGGDQIGERLLDTHFAMMKKFGVEIKREDGRYELEWKKRKGTKVFLEESSVTATEMALILASSLPEESIIEDAATEPHVKDLEDFLEKMGSKVEGAGTSTLSIKGARHLSGVTHKVVPDHIEGGTFAIAAAITQGEVVIEDFIPQHYHMPLIYLERMGINYRILDEKRLEILPSRLIAKQRKFQTRPWPGFPTDLMSPFIVLATQAEGTILCHDWMYEWRMFFVDDLIFMGANIFIADPHRVIVSGPTQLLGDILYCKDIRAGISIVLAALAAKGQSSIDNIEVIDRGYEKLEERLKGLGAEIKRIDERSS